MITGQFALTLDARSPRYNDPVSRLDSAIRRLQAQRRCLGEAFHLIRSVEGPILELGLGNGRTYDHLRKHLPNREIFVFDRQVAAHPDCIPDDKHLFLGDIVDTLPKAQQQFKDGVAMIHTDIGTGVEESNRELTKFLAAQLPVLLKPGGVLLSDRELHGIRLSSKKLPDGVAEGRYFFYRREEHDAKEERARGNNAGRLGER